MPTSPSRIPGGFVVKNHYHTDPTSDFKVKLCSYGRQNHGSWEDGYDIKKYVSNPLCADVLDELLANPIRIPDEWKGKLVFFWGTTYSISKPVNLGLSTKAIMPTSEYVRFLFMSGGEWRSEFMDVDDEFGPTRLSAELDTGRRLPQWIKNFFIACYNIRTKLLKHLNKKDGATRPQKNN